MRRVIRIHHDNVLHFIDAEKIVAMNFYIDEVDEAIEILLEFDGNDTKCYEFKIKLEENSNAWGLQLLNILAQFEETKICERYEYDNIIDDVECMVESRFGNRFNYWEKNG